MKIGIADPQTRVRYGLRILLEQQPGWTIVGEASDSQELSELVRDACPDLVLIDWDLPDIPIGRDLRMLRAQAPSLRVILMSGRQELSKAALEAGADAFACKTESPLILMNLIRGLQIEGIIKK